MLPDEESTYVKPQTQIVTEKTMAVAVSLSAVILKKMTSDQSKFKLTDMDTENMLAGLIQSELGV